MKRRMIASSTTAPSTRAAARPGPAPTSYGRPETAISPTASVVGTVPEVALGEVQDPVGPVDERQAEGQQGGEQTGDDAEDPGAAAAGEHHELERHDQQGGHVRCDRAQRGGRCWIVRGAAHGGSQLPCLAVGPDVPWPAKSLHRSCKFLGVPGVHARPAQELR